MKHFFFIPSLFSSWRRSLRGLALTLGIGASVCASLELSGRTQDPALSIITDPKPGRPVAHGLSKLSEALRAKRIAFETVSALNEAKGKTLIVAGLASGDETAAQLLKSGNRVVPPVPEALTIWKTESQGKTVWLLSGFDDRGLMYALLDTADRVSWSADPAAPLSELRDIMEQPDVRERAVSICTMHRAHWESRLYDEAHWARYLDMLAQNRINSLVVIFGFEASGFLAPCYPYFFDVEGFPEVRMLGLTADQQRRNLAAFNTLIRMAHDRGVSFTAGIWDHIWRGGDPAVNLIKYVPGHPVTNQVAGVTADNLIPYNKSALAKFIKVVPDLDAIQFRMHDESGLKKEEQLGFWESVFRMMKEKAPNLRLDLRAKGLPESVIQSAEETQVNFRIATKYWMEQLGLPYHPTHINPEDQGSRRHSYADMLRYPQKYKLHWRLWNGGASRILLWGDPEYARRFAESTHLYDGDGFEVNEPLFTKMTAQPHEAKPFDLLKPQYRYYDWEFERYWHFFQVFGRVGYNPQTPSEVWDKEFEKRFGKKAGPLLESALHQASWVVPRLVASCSKYRPDFAMTTSWIEKQRLDNLPQYAKGKGSDIQQFASFDEEAQILLGELETVRLRPSANSLWLERLSTDISVLVTQAERTVGADRNKEFESTVVDLKILSNLALYHARRIPAAVSYCLFERTQAASALDDAIAYESKALDAWRQIVAAAGDVYADDLLMGANQLKGHWRGELAALEKGLAALEQQRRGLATNAPAKTIPRYKPASAANLNALFSVTHAPITSAPVGQPISITAKATAPAGIKWVRLRYRSVNQTLDYKTLPMLPAGTSDDFQAIVPVAHIDPKFDFMYFIEVMDNEGNGRIYPDLNRETPYIVVKLIR